MSFYKTDRVRPRRRRGKPRIRPGHDLPEFHFWVLHRTESERWRLLLRLPYFLVMGLVVRVWGLLAAAVALLQWLNILVFGRRSQRLSELYLQWFTFSASLNLYVGAVTDDSPSLFLCPFKYELELEKSLNQP